MATVRCLQRRHTQRTCNNNNPPFTTTPQQQHKQQSTPTIAKTALPRRRPRRSDHGLPRPQALDRRRGRAARARHRARPRPVAQLWRDAPAAAGGLPDHERRGSGVRAQAVGLPQVSPRRLPPAADLGSTRGRRKFGGKCRLAARPPGRVVLLLCPALVLTHPRSPSIQPNPTTKGGTRRSTCRRRATPRAARSSTPRGRRPARRRRRGRGCRGAGARCGGAACRLPPPAACRGL